MLSVNSALVTGLDYSWIEYKVAGLPDQKWNPLQIQSIVPCFLNINEGKEEILGLNIYN